MRRNYNACINKYTRRNEEYSYLTKEIAKLERKYQAQDLYEGTRSPERYPAIKAVRLG